MGLHYLKLTAKAFENRSIGPKNRRGFIFQPLEFEGVNLLLVSGRVAFQNFNQDDLIKGFFATESMFVFIFCDCGLLRVLEYLKKKLAKRFSR